MWNQSDKKETETPRQRSQAAAELPVRTCQYHGGRTDENGFLVFCGKPVRRGTSYCAEHYPRIYQRAPEIGTSRAPSAESTFAEPAESTPEFEREAA